MPLIFYNTRTKRKEAFVSIERNSVRLYSCGPTVYHFAHVGNLRAYVFVDVLRRTLEYDGYTVRHVMNVTDIGHLSSDADEGEDKMVRALKREGIPMTLAGLRTVADKYAAVFLEDLRSLNMLLPDVMPRASEHIAEAIELIRRIEAADAAYRTHDGVYFDVSRFPEYGTRGGFKLGKLREGARVDANADKRGPKDFALWKFSSNEIGWRSPWGIGFPGWHVECSAMSRAYLGQPFDIHTGGIDHIPTHHQNEMAQSETAFGSPLARYWMHNAHLMLPKRKMAKSAENFITLAALAERGISPLAFRYFLLQTHYRSPLLFSWQALGAAQTALEHLREKSGDYAGAAAAPMPDAHETRFREALADDLNTPRALALLWELLKDAGVVPGAKRAALAALDRALGLRIEGGAGAKRAPVPDTVRALVRRRDTARQKKDFQRADALRAEIKSAGFDIRDTDDGPRLIPLRR